MRWTLRRIAAPEMVDHHRERHLREMILERRDDRRAGIDLHMPTQVANLFCSCVEQRLGVGGSESSRGFCREIVASAANAGVCLFVYNWPPGCLGGFSTGWFA